MKMKKLLAGVLAGTMAISAGTFTSLTLSAIDEVTNISISSPNPDGSYGSKDLFDSSASELHGINFVGADKVVFNAIANDLNSGWNSGAFYTNSNGAGYTEKTFGGTNKTPDVTLDKGGRFSVEVEIGVTDTTWFVVGYATDCQEGAFELESIGIYRGSEKIGTWSANNTFTLAADEVPRIPSIPIFSEDGSYVQNKLTDSSSQEMQGYNLVGVNKVIFNARMFDSGYGYANGSFFTNSNGGDYQKTTFGGSNSGTTIILEKGGPFSVEVGIGITDTTWFEIGYDTTAKEGSFELDSIDFYKDSEKIGTWANYTFISNTVAVESITLNKETLIIEKGKTAQLEATVLPENATDPTVTWTSSNTEVATVDEATGEITAVSEGTTTITAAAGEQTAACEVTVACV